MRVGELTQSLSGIRLRRLIPSAMGPLHRAARPALRTLGYRWEERRIGDLKLGLWRRDLTRRRPGPRRRLVVVPGFGDTPLSWFTLVTGSIPFLRRRFDELVFVDFPGFQGFLAREKAFSCMDQLLGAYYDLMDSLSPDTILGHSLGGWLTAHYAVECGKETRPMASRGRYRGPRRIILANPSGVLTSEEKTEEWKKRFEAAMKEGFRPFRPHLFYREPAWFRLLASSFEGFFSDPEVLRFMESIREDHLLNEELHHIRAKVWFLWGGQDTLVPSEWLSDWQKGFHPESRPKGVVFRKTGHSPHLERPIATAAALIGMIHDHDWIHENRLWHRIFGRIVD